MDYAHSGIMKSLTWNSLTAIPLNLISESERAVLLHVEASLDRWLGVEGVELTVGLWECLFALKMTEHK